MGIFGKQNIEKLKAMKNFKGLIGALKDKDCYVKEEAKAALVNIGKPAVESLIKALKDKDSNVRRYAAVVLGEIGDERAVEPLTEVLKNKNARWASDALRNIIGTKAVRSLTKALKDEDSDIKREVHEMKRGEIRCSKCGKIIGQSPTSIAEDIRRGGGVIIGGDSLDMPMYQCTICESCGSAFCDSCQRPNPDPCPKCGKSNLRPGFADLVQKYYKF